MLGKGPLSREELTELRRLLSIDAMLKELHRMNRILRRPPGDADDLREYYSDHGIEYHDDEEEE